MHYIVVHAGTVVGEVDLTEVPASPASPTLDGTVVPGPAMPARCAAAAHREGIVKPRFPRPIRRLERHGAKLSEVFPFAPACRQVNGIYR